MDRPILSLRGEIDGVARTFPLPRGEHRIGSSSASDVLLPVRGVSRQHAVLKVTAHGAALEDRGSKNGTFVNGESVERAAVTPPAELRFGPVTLHLRALDRSDSELAIRFDPPPDRSFSTPFDQTTDFEDQEVPASWLGLLAKLAVPLKGSAPQGFGSALALLVESLQADGGWVVEWKGEPVVLATSGRSGGTLEERLWSEDGNRPFRLVHQPGRVAAFQRGVERTLGVVLWGDFPDSQRCEPLLAAFLTLLFEAAQETVRSGPSLLLPPLAFPPDIVTGSSVAMAELYRRLHRLVPGTEPVLVTRETGVGKEHVARLLHDSSRRHQYPFVAVNCTAIAPELLEAEMFGIGRHVATGVAERPGLFRQAMGGTLFLDEIGEMPTRLQPKLLRALQEGEVRPVGGAAEVVDLRVIAATNADLARRLAEGTFREDLYYRLAASVLEVPPLRRRREDIGPLVEHFVGRFGKAAESRPRGLSVKALGHLVAYPWPGNIRELEHEVRRLVAECPDGEVIDSSMLSPRLTETEPAQVPAGELAFDARVEALERELITEALRRCEGKRVAAARILGISRNRLARKLERLVPLG